MGDSDLNNFLFILHCCRRLRRLGRCCRLFPMPYGMGYMLMPSTTADSGLADLGELGRILNGFCLGFGPVGLQPEDVRRYADGDRE